MLLLAHVSREDIPPPLQKDLEFLLTKGMPMLQEMLALATAPRMQVSRRGCHLSTASPSVQAHLGSAGRVCTRAAEHLALCGHAGVSGLTPEWLMYKQLVH